MLIEYSGNIVAKGEIDHFWQFLFLLQCFQKSSVADQSKNRKSQLKKDLLTNYIWNIKHCNERSNCSLCIKMHLHLGKS